MSKSTKTTTSTSISPEKLSQKERQNMVNAVMSMTIPFWGTLQSATIDIRILEVDRAYQRFTHSKLKYLIDHFNYKYMSPLTVSYRNGHFYIVDGQHRAIAASRNGISQLPCIIHTGLTQADEAKIFSLQKKGSSGLQPLDTFKANLIWGEATDCAIKDLCDKYTLTIRSRQTEPFTMSSITAAREIVKDTRCGIECLDWMFDIFQKSKWLSEKGGCVYYVMKAMQAAYTEATTNKTLDIATEKLTACFLKIHPSKIEGFAKVKYGKERRKACAELFRDIAKGVYTGDDINALHISND